MPTPPTPTPPRLIDTAPVSSIDYGIHLFIWGQPATTQRDLTLATDAGLRWQKSLFQWRLIEGSGKGQFDWAESDRVVRASTAASVRIIARLDFEPMWARRDHANNGPPDNYQDYWDFVSQFVSRYSSASAIGRVHAIEVWNEPNLDREWGNQPISPDSAADYVRLLGGAYLAAHAADPNIVVLSAGLSPTGVTDAHSADDVEYLTWMYKAGVKGKFDVLGAHANTQAPEVAAPFGSLKDFPHPSFYFRRVEQLRQVMLDNGDGSQADLVGRVGLDRRPSPSRVQLVCRLRRPEGREHRGGLAVCARSLDPVDGGHGPVDVFRPDVGPEPGRVLVGHHRP